MRRLVLFGVAAAVLMAAMALGVSLLPRTPAVDFTQATHVDRAPQIRPDYRDAVIPPNIAPLNFLINEPGLRYSVRVRAEKGPGIDVVSRGARIDIPAKPWRELLQRNRGGTLHVDVCVRGEDGKWRRFKPIKNTIAEEEIDNYLCYRLIKPIYILRKNVDIYQRDLRTFDESIVVSNRSFLGGCVNCHTPAPNHADRMIVHARNTGPNAHQASMILLWQGQVRKIDTRTLANSDASCTQRIKESLPAYTAWHPNGELAAYSANRISQFFHAVGNNRDVFDSDSDLALYHADSNTVTTTAEICRPDRLETFPAWSPDGRYLYFCSADPLPIDRYQEVRYDLMRIRYDADSGHWGELEPVLRAKDTGLSISEPRISPNGRWLLCCMSEYGSLPAYQESSDLYLLDLETRKHHRLAVNSPRCDSWHCWSSNSRWIAFASKRRDGLFARIYFSYIDDAGQSHKAVLLPQKDPTFYDRFIKTYNVPELSRWPVSASPRELARAIRSRHPGAPTFADDSDEP
jgi:hypothetical protein